MTLQELRDKRASIVTEMRALHEAAEKAERGFTSDEDAKWNAMDADLQQVDSSIKRAEKLGDAARVVPSELRGARPDAGTAPEQRDGKAQAEAQKRAFEKYLRMQEMTTEERQLIAPTAQALQEMRAFSAGTANTGGATVPQDFFNQLEVALKAYGGMMETASILRTDTGATLPMPTFNYTGVAATIVGENTAGTADSSTPFGSVSLGAYTYRSPILPVSYEFLQDSSFGEGFIVDALSDSLGRGLNAHATTGTGTGQPRGIVTDAVLGKTGTTGQTLTVVADDLIDLVHSIDPAYRKSGAKFMMHDQSLKVVRKLKDTAGRPVFLPGYDGLGGAMGDEILGYGVSINQDMAQMGANAKSILFGRLDKYKLRIVRAVTMLRLTERYADALQVAFILFMRADGRLLDAGTNPVKYYQNSAT